MSSTVATPEDGLLIGDFAKRAGVAASALRFYEERGLISSTGRRGGRRVYARSALRRVAFIQAAQAVGFALEEIGAMLSSLPQARTPTAADWAQLSTRWLVVLEERIKRMTLLKDSLTACIGCGCLSLEKCALYNPGDEAASTGAGARRFRM